MFNNLYYFVGKTMIKRIIFSLMLSTTLISGGVQNSMCQMKPITFTKDTLPNGLQVIYHVDKTAPVVASIVHYRVGSRDEFANQTGYAHFFEHLMFEATNNIPRASIDKYIQEAGGDLNAHTSFDETVYYQKLPSNEIKLALWIESERMRGLLINSDGVETQRGVVTEELKMRRNNQPYGTLLDKMCEGLFPGGSYSWTTLGSADHIAAATIKDFRAFYDNFYQPNNATLVLAGDIDIDETRKMVDEYFATIPNAPLPKREDFKIMPMKGEIREKIDDPKAQLPGIFIGYRSPSLGDLDYYAFSLLMDVLSEGESSRLYQEIVDKKQLAAQVAAFPLSLEKSGLGVFYAIASPGKDPEEIEKLMMKEVAKIVKDGITDKELEKAKNIKEARLISENLDNMEKARNLARYNSYYGDPAMINNEIKHYLDVKKDDIQRVAKLYLSTDQKVVLYYLPNSSK